MPPVEFETFRTGIADLLGATLRHREMHRSSATDGARRPDPSAMRVDDAPADREPEPGACTGLALSLPEPIEDVLEMLSRNAGTGVLDR